MKTILLVCSAGMSTSLLVTKIEKLAASRKAGAIPVDVIDMRDYGTMNGKAVLATALKLLGE